MFANIAVPLDAFFLLSESSVISVFHKQQHLLAAAACGLLAVVIQASFSVLH